MAENIEEVIQEETIQNDITPVAETETIETDIEVTDGDQQVDVVTDVTTGEPEKTNEEKLADVHKKQDEMRREALKNGNLANINNDPTYKALIKQSQDLNLAIKTQDITLGDVLSNLGEENQQQSDQQIDKSKLLQGGITTDATPLDKKQREDFNNYLKGPKTYGSTSENSEDGILGFGKYNNNVNNNNTFGTQDESIIEQNKYFNSTVYLGKIPDERTRQQQMLINGGYGLENFMTQGSFYDYTITSQASGEGTILTEGQDQLIYSYDENGMVTTQAGVKDLARNIFYDALGITDKLNNIPNNVSNYEATYNEIVYEAVNDPANKAFVTSLFDNSLSRINDVTINNIITEETEKTLNSLMPSYSMTAKYDGTDPEGNTIKKGDIFTFDYYAIANQAIKEGKTIDDLLLDYGQFYDVERGEIKADLSLEGKDVGDITKMQLSNMFKNINDRFSEEGKIATDKGMSFILGRKFKITSDTDEFVKSLQKQQDDITYYRGSGDLGIGGGYRAYFDERDLEVVNELVQDQYTYEVIQAKDVKSKEDEETLEALKKTYGDDLSVISKRRMALIETALGSEFQEKSASLVIDPFTGDVYSKDKDNRIKNYQTGEELNASEIPEKLEDYRLFLANKYEGTDIESAIVNTYLKIQTLASMLGENGINRKDESSSWNSFKGLEFWTKMIGNAFDKTTADDKVQAINDPEKPLDLINDTDMKSAGSAGELYNSLVKELRNLTTFKVLNYSPLEMRRAGFGKGFEVGMDDFIFDFGTRMPNSYELVETYDEWVSKQTPADRELLNKHRDNFFEGNEIKQKWDYGVGYQTPFWLRLSAEFAATELTFGAGIAAGVNTISRFVELSYLSRMALKGEKGFQAAKRTWSMSKGSILSEKAYGYMNSTSNEFFKLYFYNQTFGQMGKDKEMPYSFTILGPAGYAYSKYLGKIFGTKGMPISSKAPKFKDAPFLYQMNILGRENIPYYQILTTVPRETFLATGSAGLLQVGTSFDAAIEAFETKNGKGSFNMDTFLSTFSLDHFTQNMALSLIMRGTAPNKVYSELSQRYSQDVAQIRAKNWYKKAVKQAEKDFGIELDKEWEANSSSEKVYLDIEKKLIERLGNEGYRAYKNLKELGYKFDNINENSSPSQIEKSLLDFAEKNKDQVSSTTFNYLTLRNPEFIKKLAVEGKKAQTLGYEIEFGNFIEQYKLMEETTVKLNNAVTNLLENKLTAQDYRIMADYNTPEIFIQLLKERGVSDKETTQVAIDIVENGIEIVKSLKDNGLADLKAADNFINNHIKLSQLKSKELELIEAQKRGAFVDLQLSEVQEQIKKVEAAQRKVIDVEFITEAETLALQARDRLIEQRKQAGGDIVQFGFSQKRVQDIMNENPKLTSAQARNIARNENLNDKINELVEKGELDINDPALKKFVKDGKIVIPDGTIVEAALVKTKSTGEKIKIPTLFIDQSVSNRQIDLHEGSHPVLNVLMKRMGINDFSSAQAQEFVNAFRNSIPKKARDILNKRLQKDLNIDLNDPSTFKGKDLTEVFTRYIEEYDKLSADEKKKFFTPEALEGMKQFEGAIENIIDKEFGVKIDYEVGVNFIQQLAREMVAAKVEGSLGPEGKFIEVDAAESIQLSSVENGSQFVDMNKLDNYQRSLEQDKQLLELLKEDTEPSAETLKQIKRIEKEIATKEKNINISDANLKDIELLQELERRIENPEIDPETGKEKTRLQIEQDLAEETGRSINEVLNLERELANRNIGAVKELYSSFPSYMKEDLRVEWEEQIKKWLIHSLKTYDPAKGSVWNHLQPINKRYTDLADIVDKGKITDISLNKTDPNTGKELGDNLASDYDNSTQNLIDQIVVTRREKPLTEQEKNTKFNGDNINENFTSEDGNKIKTQLAVSAFNYFRSLDYSRYVNDKGQVDHKKMLTDFYAEARRPGNENLFRSLVKKPTAKYLGWNTKTKTLDKNSEGYKTYKKDLEGIYNWLIDFSYRNPQIIKNANWGNTGASTDWYTLGAKMSVAESIQAGTTVKNVKAGNKQFEITPPSFDAFMTMMVDIPLTKSNPNSALESKLVQVYNMMSFDFYQQRLNDYILSNGTAGSGYNLQTGKFDNPSKNPILASGAPISTISDIAKVTSSLRPSEPIISNSNTQSGSVQFSSQALRPDQQFRINEYIKTETEILANELKVPQSLIPSAVRQYNLIINDVSLSAKEREEMLDKVPQVVDIALSVDAIAREAWNIENEKADVSPSFKPQVGDKQYLVDKTDYRGKKGEENKRNSRYWSERVKTWGDFTTEKKDDLNIVTFKNKEDRDAALKLLEFSKQDVESYGDNSISFKEISPKLTKTTLSDIKNGVALKFVNPEVYNRHRQYSKELGKHLIYGGDITLNHLTMGDWRQGVGPGNMYVWDAKTNAPARDANGNLVKFEKYSGTYSEIKNDATYKGSLVNEKHKSLVNRANELNSLATMNMVTNFIQYNDLPVNSKGEIIKGYQGKDGALIYDGKEYAPTKKGKEELYDAVFTKEEELLRKEIFEANYEGYREWLNEVDKNSEEWDRRYDYLLYTLKEGSNLQKGWRNMAGFSPDGTGGQMMYIPDNPIEKISAGTPMTYDNGQEVVIVEKTKGTTTKVEHADPNVNVMNQIAEGLANNKEYTEQFGDNHQWRTMWGDVNTFEVIDQSKALGLSKVQLKTGGDAATRFVVLNRENLYFRGKDGKVTNVLNNQARELEKLFKVKKREKALDLANKTMDQVEQDGINLGNDPIEGINVLSKVINNSKESGKIPKGSTAKETNTNSNEFIGSGSTQFSLNEGGDRLIPNETGKFSPKHKVILTMGGPGSGKTTLLNTFLNENNISGDITQVNMDIFKESIQEQFPDLPSKESERTKEQQSLGGQIQALARKEKDLFQKETSEKGDGMAIDMTGASMKSTMKIVEDLRSKGYEVFVLHAQVSKQTSINRNQSRGERGERSLPDWVVANTWDAVTQNVPQYKEIFGDKFFSVDAEQIPEGTIPKEISEGLFNKLNANNIETVPGVKDNPNLSTTMQFSLSENTGDKKDYINMIIDRNVSAKNKKPLSDAELQASIRKPKRRIRLQPNSYSHMDTMLSRFFKNRQDFELADKMINDTYIKDQIEFNVYKDKVMNDLKGFNRAFSKTVRQNPDMQLFKMRDRAFGEFSKEDVIRAYCFMRNGYTPKGLSEADIININKYINNDPTMLNYANGLMTQVVSNDGAGLTYFKPGDNWLQGSIYNDMRYGINSARQNYFTKSIENMELLFGDGNLEKMALEVNDKTWLQNMQGLIDYMKSGELSSYTDPTTRKAMGIAMGYSRLGLAGSVRSFITQFTSAELALFYEGEGVSPLKMPGILKNPTRGFEEVREYMKSPYFGTRGKSFDLTLSEIQDLETKWSSLKNKSASLSFALSSLGDKGAIALSAFYVLPQRIDYLVKEKGMDIKEARKMAHDEFNVWVEKTQQSVFGNLLGTGQRGIFGKLTTGFLNSPIRYSNRAVVKLNKALMKDVESGKLDIKSSAKDLMQLANYMVVQGLLFGTVQQGVAYTFFDDEMDPEQRDKVLQKKKENVVKNQWQTVVNARGPEGKLITALYNSIEKYVLENPDQAKVEGMDMVYQFLRDFSPALGVRMDLAKSAAYDLSDIRKMNKEADKGPVFPGSTENGKEKDTEQDIMPYLKFATKTYALFTGQAMPKEIVERIGDVEFMAQYFKDQEDEEALNDIRVTFWNMLATALGQSPWIENPEAAKQILGGQKTKKSSSTFPGSLPSDDTQYVPLGSGTKQKASPFD